MTNHIYQNHLEQVMELLSRKPLRLPRFEIRDEEHNLRGLEGLLSMGYEHLVLTGYESHAKIAAPVAVVLIKGDLSGAGGRPRGGAEKTSPRARHRKKKTTGNRRGG